MFRNCWLQAQPCPVAQAIRQQRDTRAIFIFIFSGYAHALRERLVRDTFLYRSNECGITDKQAPARAAPLSRMDGQFGSTCAQTLSRFRDRTASKAKFWRTTETCTSLHELESVRASLSSNSALWRGVRARRHVHCQLRVWCGVDHSRIVARGVHKGLAGRGVGNDVLARRYALRLACGRWGAWR